MPKLEPMKFKTKPGERLYAVAVQEASGLWLVMWVKRSIDEVFVFALRLDQGSNDRWEVHARLRGRCKSIHMPALIRRG